MGGVLVHEWLARTGGSENVFDAMVDAFPDADLLCLWNDVPGRYPGRRLDETWLARTPLRHRKSLALPAMAATWRQRRGDYDWALVSSHAFAHHVSFRDQPHDFAKLVYVHSPARYLWEPDLDERGAGGVVRVAGTPLRALDRERAREIAGVAANSRYIARRVQRAWGLESRVIYPPVRTERIAEVDDWSALASDAERDVLDGLPEGFLLGASRLITYKRLDLVIRAGEALGRPVVIAGSGPEGPALRRLAASVSVPVRFVGRTSDELLYALYQRAVAFVFPAVEDFGIMPVEAMATGTPVIARAEGGTRETVQPGVNGAHADFDDAASIRDAARTCASLTRAQVAGSVARFSTRRFHDEIRRFVRECASDG